jgi:hypothetical protein
VWSGGHLRTFSDVRGGILHLQGRRTVLDAALTPKSSHLLNVAV